MTENITFEQCVRKSYPTGSRYICNPPVMNTDRDTVILVEGFYDWAALLIRDGWVDCGQYDKEADFRAFRKGEDNYIITENDEFYQAYVTATDVCKDLNLLDKNERITVFQRMLAPHDGYQGLCTFDKNVVMINDMAFRLVAGGNDLQAMFAADPQEVA